MTNPSRLDRVRDALTQALAPQTLDVVDDSEHHRGHAGHHEGEITHLRVRVVAAAFQDLGRVARQRLVNQALAGEFASGLHALALKTLTPDEAAQPRR